MKEELEEVMSTYCKYKTLKMGKFSQPKGLIIERRNKNGTEQIGEQEKDQS